jgi:hypothetical protein
MLNADRSGKKLYIYMSSEEAGRENRSKRHRCIAYGPNRLVNHVMENTKAASCIPSGKR